MKTLDEVIKACEETVSDVDRGVDIEGCFLGATETRDALHYLKAFRDAKDALEREKDRYAEAVKNCERAENIYKQKQKAAEDALWICKEDKDDLTALRAYWAEQQANPAMTWDELRQMEGKPVWIEPCKEWMLITEIETEPHIWLLSLDGLDYDMSLHEWQAYRKER